MIVSSGEAYSNPYRPRRFVREWRRKVYTREPGQRQQWDRYVRCENQRREERGEDPLESQEFQVGICPGWLETLYPRVYPSGGSQYHRERPGLLFAPVIGLTSRRLTRCSFRTPVTCQGDLAEGIPLHVSLPNDPGVIKAALRACRAVDFRATVRLEKWSNRKNPRSLTRTAYKIVGGTLQGLLQDLENQKFLPPKRDFESSKGVWHVSC